MTQIRRNIGNSDYRNDYEMISNNEGSAIRAEGTRKSFIGVSLVSSASRAGCWRCSSVKGVIT